MFDDKSYTEDPLKRFVVENLGQSIYFLEKMYGEDLLEKVYRSILNLRNNCLETSEVKYLPSTTLKSMSYCKLMYYWDFLPIEIKTDENFLINLPCYKHYNTGRTQIDGGPGRRRFCPECIEEGSKFEPFIPDFLIEMYENVQKK